MKKVAICYSGGAIKGAFQAGVASVIDRLPVIVKGIAGTSTGSLTGVMHAQGRVQQLLDIYYGISGPKDIYKHWLGWYLTGYFKGGLYNFKPLRNNLIEPNVNVSELMKSKIKYAACCCDIDSGETVYAENIPENQFTIKDFIFASACIPGTAPPVKIKGSRYVDGGVNEPVPVEKLVEMTKADDIDYYIIVLADKMIKPGVASKPKKLIPIIMRSIDMLFNEVFKNDVTIGMAKYWKEKFIIIEPNTQIFDSSFDVDPAKIKAAIDQGHDVANKAFKDVVL